MTDAAAPPAAGAREEAAPGAADIVVSASASFGALLAQHRMSLLVSTYEAGALVVLRADGPNLSMHMVRVDRAMGVAASAHRLALGTRHRILEMCNMPSVVAGLPPAPAGQPLPDACYVPVNSHVTGEIDIHEMAWGGEELWYVNTKFSCLCTRDALHSFVPRWRPPFVKGLSGDDRCHLNGLAMRDGRPAYVTAFAVTDEPEGWRPVRKTGGVVLDVATGAIVAGGLSMPHSPRLHGGSLWMLESGRGSLARVDPKSGKVDTMIAFPGFSRGLAFSANLAFVGLSKARESVSFGGIPLTEQYHVDERFCGVQVIDVLTGRSVAFVQFEAGVGEIFAVEALPEVRFPAFLDDADPLLGASYVLSPDALAQVRR